MRVRKEIGMRRNNIIYQITLICIECLNAEAIRSGVMHCFHSARDSSSETRIRRITKFEQRFFKNIYGVHHSKQTTHSNCISNRRWILLKATDLTHFHFGKRNHLLYSNEIRILDNCIHFNAVTREG